MTHEQVLQMVSRAIAMLVTELCAALELVPPFTAEDLRDKVQKWKRCRIDILPYSMLDENVFGMCVCKRPSYYVIFYRAGAPYVQKQRIIFHELCHIILSHVTPANPVAVLRESLAATLQEFEAETFAQLGTGYALTPGQKGLTEGSSKEPLASPTDQYSGFLEAIGG